MKKLILLLALAFVMCGCTTRYQSRGPRMPFDVHKGSIRTTETDEYIATEVCVMLNGVGKIPVWKLESVQKKNQSVKSKNDD